MSNNETKETNKIFNEIVDFERDSYFGKLETFEVYKARKVKELEEEWESYNESLSRGYKAIIQKVEVEKLYNVESK